ncbi:MULTISPECIES: hypothetical protein [unclassified Rhodococcus (in: high G+C Gram-positive bacteria)]|uniref:hypothetical protein n=1 Tax=unclassified Rhodococcus (in: high G+C Gram-positive bacteria) TaxID=192944 RepID=UPI000A97C41E|nr:MULTISPECIES: hypothetical protein [unclassified Rhodococcus (in: high G+C Gram-positive bacteria)]
MRSVNHTFGGAYSHVMLRLGAGSTGLAADFAPHFRSYPLPFVDAPIEQVD